jgi:hypothetical protein
LLSGSHGRPPVGFRHSRGSEPPPADAKRRASVSSWSFKTWWWADLSGVQLAHLASGQAVHRPSLWAGELCTGQVCCRGAVDKPRTRRAVHRLALWAGGLSTAGASCLQIQLSPGDHFNARLLITT